MLSLNSKDLGMDHDFELTGRDESEIMRKFIDYTETELKIPFLSAETIYRVKTALKK
jgi:predicted small metal-binding protein